jgi:DNA-binding transcriptional MerR regulator
MMPQLHKIGDIAQRFGLTLRTLRFWEDKKLIRPVRDGTTQLYPDSEVQRIERIVPMSRAGISLQRIAALLSMAESGYDEACSLFLAGLLLERHDALRKQLAHVEQMLLDVELAQEKAA